MMRRLFFFALLLLSLSLSGQTDWRGVQRLIDNGSYNTAYSKAETIYKSNAVEGRQRLVAAYYMAQASSMYQEGARDSAVARYRALLSGATLSALDRALCYAFLGSYDSALVDSVLLQHTPVEAVREFCTEPGRSQNMTPTVYDMLVVMMQEGDTLTPQQKVEWQRRLCAFHAGDEDDCIRIWHDCRLLDFLEEVPNRHLDLSTYQHYIDKYRGTKCDQVTWLYANAANHCFRRMKDLAMAVAYCDTAIALFPKSEGGVECANLRSDITAPCIEFSRELHFLIPQREELMGIEYRNLSEVHLRLVEEPESYMDDRQLARLKPLREWTVEVGGEGLKVKGDTEKGSLLSAFTSHLSSSAFVLPPLPTGRYRLLAAPTADFSKGMAGVELHVTDIALRYTHDGRGLVVDLATGAPVAGQAVQLVAYRTYGGPKERVLQTVVTAADGTYRFDSVPPRGSVIRLVRDGYTIVESVYDAGNSSADGQRTRFHLVSDKPVYRLGDTVRVAVTLYRSDGRDGELLAAGHQFRLKLGDPHGEEVEQLTLTTDDFGMAQCMLVLPGDRLPGGWAVVVRDSTGIGALDLRVEEYKQPRFTVSLAAEGTAPHFGQPCTVHGTAAAYSGVSVGNARVQYTVTRSQWLWRRGPSIGTVVARGETQTATDGTFSVPFTPEPDSSVELSTKPVFIYRVYATVTDLNGESHDAEATIRVGYRNVMVRLGEVKPSVRELQVVKVDMTDINNTPLQGRVEVGVERLQRPSPMLLTPLVLERGMHQTLDSADYRRRFPHYIYDREENDRQLWPAEWRWMGVADDGEVVLPQLKGGIYRIVASALDGGDTVTDTVYTVLTTADDRLARTDEILWADQDKLTAQPGERVVFRVGSAYKDVKAFYWIEYGDRKTLTSGWLTLGEQLQEVGVDVDSAQLGGLTMTLTATYMGQTVTKKFSVEVPYTHKRLKVEISTFRDKLQPGESEEWTVKVESGTGGVESAMIMTMYDDALNTYAQPSWNLSPWRGHTTVWQTDYSPYFHWNSYNGGTYRNYNGTYPTVWTLKDAVPCYNGWRGRRMYKSAAAGIPLEVATELLVLDDDASSEAVVQTNANDVMVQEEEAEEAIFSVAEKATEVQVRTNLSTLAFFAPSLRTDADGILTYRFTVPELLTRWNVRGLALTKDLKAGVMDKTLVTQKPLMVQPNMPRFLRHGDSLTLMAKVINMTEDEREVEVDFSLCDSADTMLCFSMKRVTVQAQGSVQVTFDVEVPQDVYVVEYHISAQTADEWTRRDLPRYSDGERGRIPVVSNRQAVTVSQAMYINGVGEKHYSLPEWQAGSDTRQPQLVMAESVSNPIWLAIKAMPYLETFENPSTLYLADQLYVNGLGAKIMESLPFTVDSLRLSDDGHTVNSKQSTVNKRHILLQGLAERQNGDGGWPWMPEGRSSLWVTQQVLQKVYGLLDTKRALAYVDSEQQRHYERYVKPYAKKYKWQPTDIDYLYMRSMYGKASTEAYKFYYSNALKNYKQYNNLYTQAQLALVFHRHGDKKAALDLLHRLKEKSLESDEMGLYWRDNSSGWFWYSRPIETQAFLIQAFAEITPHDTATIGLMQQWLLKQKQTTHWGNERATAEAIKALIVGSHEIRKTQNVKLTVFGDSTLTAVDTASPNNPESYVSHRWTGSDLDTLAARRTSDIVMEKTTPGIAWGAVYYQFTDDIDKIPASEMGIKISRSYISDGKMHVGDRIKVRIEITADRAMDYLELVDGRPSCTEPISTRSGWRWNDGLSYYVTVSDTDTRFYIEHIDKGHYVAEYELYVTNPGTFLTGPAVMQCMYAPEFRAVVAAERLIVEE